LRKIAGKILKVIEKRKKALKNITLPVFWRCLTGKKGFCKVSYITA
jgi:hypothetical protein